MLTESKLAYMPESITIYGIVTVPLYITYLRKRSLFELRFGEYLEKCLKPENLSVITANESLAWLGIGKPKKKQHV